MAVGTCSTVRSSSVSLPIAVTICESPNVKPVDVRTTQARCPQAHRRNNNRPEQNKKCVTHVPGCSREGLQSIERLLPPHPHPLPCGEREPPAQAARPSIASCCPIRLP